MARTRSVSNWSTAAWAVPRASVAQRTRLLTMSSPISSIDRLGAELFDLVQRHASIISVMIEPPAWLDRAAFAFEVGLGDAVVVVTLR